ncbi:MAG TPA: MarR family transcriptional regulator [Sporichthyaceae bacterium]
MPVRIEMAHLVRLRMALGRVGRLLRQQTADDLTYPQISLLFAIERRQPVTARDLALDEGVTPPSVTRSFNELAAAGLVERERDPRDGRAFLIRLTSAGREECHRLRHSRDEWLSEHLAALSSADLAALLAALPALERLTELDQSAQMPSSRMRL